MQVVNTMLVTVCIRYIQTVFLIEVLEFFLRVTSLGYSTISNPSVHPTNKKDGQGHYLRMVFSHYMHKYGIVDLLYVDCGLTC